MRYRTSALWSGCLAAASVAAIVLGGRSSLGQGREGIVPRPDLQVLTIRPDRGEGAWYRPGDRISFVLDVPEAGNLTVYDVTPRGQVQVVFPHTWNRGCRVARGRVALPGRGDRWHYEIGRDPGGQGGVECVIAVLTTRQHPPPRWLPGVRLGATDGRARPADVLRKRVEEARGLNERIVLGPKAVPWHWRRAPYRVAQTWIRVRPANDHPPRR